MNAQGAPESETLYKILEILFTKEEAEFVSKLPIRFFTIQEAALRIQKSEDETRKILDTLADKGILLDIERGKTKAYILAPTMAGFFEFSLMRTDGMFDRKILSELFYQYINQEEGFVKNIFGMKNALDRTFVHEDQLQEKDVSIILDYEKASKVIETASCISVGTCYCRHKMEHAGKACKNPQDVCLTFNKAAESLVKHGISKSITKKEAFNILKKSRESGLVQIGDNVQEGVNWICNCCGCCCEALLAYKKLGYKNKIHSNFYAEVKYEKCVTCQICIKKCPIQAISLIGGKIMRDQEKCIGCGVCTRFCPKQAIEMVRKEKLLFTPKDGFERYVINAIEEGRLQDYLFDNYGLWSNELLRNFLKIILSLTPKKLLMAQNQIRSRYVEAATKTRYYALFNELYNEGKKQDYSHKELK